MAALFVGCSPSVVRCIKSVVDFDLFSAIFISSIIKDIRKAPHRKLEIKKVSERAVLTHPVQLAIHSLKITTTGEEDLRVTRLKCKSDVNVRNQYDC